MGTQSRPRISEKSPGAYKHSIGSDVRARSTLLSHQASHDHESSIRTLTIEIFTRAARLSRRATDDQESLSMYTIRAGGPLRTTRAGGPASVGLRLFRKGGSCRGGCRGGSAPYSTVIEVSVRSLGSSAKSFVQRRRVLPLASKKCNNFRRTAFTCSLVTPSGGRSVPNR